MLLPHHNAAVVIGGAPDLAGFLRTGKFPLVRLGDATLPVILIAALGHALAVFVRDLHGSQKSVCIVGVPVVFLEVQLAGFGIDGAVGHQIAAAVPLDGVGVFRLLAERIRFHPVGAQAVLILAADGAAVGGGVLLRQALAVRVIGGLQLAAHAACVIVGDIQRLVAQIVVGVLKDTLSRLVVHLPRRHAPCTVKGLRSGQAGALLRHPIGIPLNGHPVGAVFIGVGIIPLLQQAELIVDLHGHVAVLVIDPAPV